MRCVVDMPRVLRALAVLDRLVARFPRLKAAGQRARLATALDDLRKEGERGQRYGDEKEDRGG
jgi:hypothetical protein